MDPRINTQSHSACRHLKKPQRCTTSLIVDYVYISLLPILYEKVGEIFNFVCHLRITILGLKPRLKPDQAQARPDCGLRVGLEYWQA